MKERKLLSLLLAFCLVLTWMPGVVMATNAPTSGTVGEGLSWTLKSGTLTISGKGMIDAGDSWEMPWHESLEAIKSVVIKSGATGIGNYAFSGCINLTSVTIPSTVTYIGWDAFGNCQKLTTITLPDNVTEIAGCAFTNCTSLTTITLPKNLKTIGGWAFENCRSLTKIHIPQKVSYIGEAAFEECPQITGFTVDSGNAYFSADQKGVLFDKNKTQILVVPKTISGTYTIPSTVTGIDEGVFYGCSRLTGITIPESITWIGDYAFYYCSSLTSIHIPKNVSEIGQHMFNNCTSLKKITVDPANSHYTNDAQGVLFNKSKTELLAVPATLSGTYTIPSGVTKVGVAAFEGCTHLTEIIIPNTVTSISESAFAECKGITEMVIPSKVTSIGGSAFQSCDELACIFIPVSVKSFGYDVFYDCAFLTDLYYGGTQAQWNQITKRSPDDFKDLEIHFNSTGIPVPPAAVFKGASVSLNGIINVNFYAEISEEATKTAKMVLTVNGKTQELSISEATVSKGLYVFTCEVAAKQMADEITAQIYVDGQPVGEPATYSVQRYCENKLTNADTKETLKNLLVAMLNYGTAAQNYFAYNTDDPANGILTNAQKQMASVSASDLDAFTMSVSGTDAGIAKSGASLLLEAETIIRYRVQLNEGYAIKDYTFRYGNQVLTPVADPTQASVYYVDITGIAAKDLDKMYPITVGGLRISYGPMSYVQRQLDKDTTRNVVTALYHYNQMANAYFA